MDTVIVYVDDADYARQILTPLTQGSATAHSTHWVLVACAPRMTHRISKWVSHSARESWRAKWADKLFAQLLPWMQADDAPQVSKVLAKTPLPELIVQLQQQYGAQTQVIDARRPKQDASSPVLEAQEPAMAAVTATPAPKQVAVPVVTKKPSRSWSLPGTLASLGFMMTLALDA